MKRLIELLKSNEKVCYVLTEYGEQIKKIAALSGMIIVGLIIFSAGGGSGDDTSAGASGESSGDTIQTGSIFVDIGGAVKTPMLAELPEGSRVEDAIVAAGGLTEDADISSINRAEFLEDGTKIYIPAFAQDEEGNKISDGGAGSFSSAGISSNGKVNINTADSETLQTLTGIGPVTAGNIITYRESSGRFSSIEDLKNVSGIGDKTFEKLRDYITI